MVNLLIPEPRILENNNNFTLGIWLSGGADSSLLCYLLAKHIKDNNLPYKLQPVTIPKRPTDTHYANVLEFVKKELDCADLFCTPIVYHTDNGSYETSFEELNLDNISQGKYNWIYTGINQTPPPNTINEYASELERVRSNDSLKMLFINAIVEHEGTYYEFGEIRPFFNVDKRYLATLYHQEELFETLFPLTNSCSQLDLVDDHCGECWFCKERIWGFGKL